MLFTFLSPQKHPPRILHPHTRFPPRPRTQRITHQHMIFHDQNFLLAHPSHHGRMRHKRHPPRGVLYALHFHRRQGRQRLANALRLLRIRVSILSQLKWLIGLRRRNNCHGHISQFRRQPRIGCVETHVIIGILVCRLLVKHRAFHALTQHQRLIVTLIRPSAAAGVGNRLHNRLPVRRRVQHASHWLRERCACPFSASLLIQGARLILGLSLSRN